ncbi:MAG: hypothetical protein WAL95_01715 [Candidatus Acidiferrales bacterium]
MALRKYLIVLVCLVSGSISALPTEAATSCTSSQQAAVECFVANAVATDLTKPRYGMSLAQFESYGVAVSEILQTRQTYLVLVGVSSAAADALPPTNANGSANLLAQQQAVSEIIAAASTAGLVPIPANTTLHQMEWFALDVSDAMNDNGGILQLLTPGVAFRMIDSYVVTATSGSTVNWAEVQTNLTNAVNNFVKAGLIKIPAGMTAAKITTFANAIAHVIYSYKVATGRKALS